MNTINHVKGFKNWMKITQRIMIKRAGEGIICLEMMPTGRDNVAIIGSGNGLTFWTRGD